MTTTFDTAATRRLGIAWPIIQGPFGGGLSTPLLTATVSNLGGMGSYGAHVLAPSDIGRVTAQIRQQTTQPFALNLWISDHDPGGAQLDNDAFEATYALFAPYFEALGVHKPAMPAYYHPPYAEQVDALLEAAPPVFSFVFGVPSKSVLAACRHRGILTLGAATSVAEAQLLESSGVDLIVATGFEAGGHRPSFLAPAEESLTGTLALVQLVSDRVTIPVIAAGGIADARGIRAALTLGAAAAQIGTAFLACEESGTSDAHRAALFGDGAFHTTLTRSFTGRLARGIRNHWTDAVAKNGHPSAPFPVQSWFLSQLKAAAVAQGRTDLVSLWSGQIAPNLRHRRAADLMHALKSGLTGTLTAAG
ncbi:NAD(P)H-dependent flavin oxidoreductase [Tahibacter amnicola]|uniref:Propionate 3-nitronate monooxygenase n=1 Tax=Tahibacter amnicola TaxID=2976241 RepID=A0ABY6BKN5_9GAMM|nr:nitronate monooxygenase [Tahibacter amnicola]UXI69973.1 nitronate monooxygenase [Tahibacter amnicola]